MRFAFASDELEELYLTGQSARLHPNVVRAFLRALARLTAAVDERDLRANKGLRMEKLRGNREGQYSVRLNEQWRLVFTIQHDEQGQLLVLIDIVDYH